MEMLTEVKVLLVISLALSTHVLARYLPENSRPNDRIIGGLNVEEGTAPFVVSVQNRQGQHICSGVIVTSEWVLTTAFCTQKSTEGFRVAAGSKDLNASTAIHEVDSINVHPSYEHRKPGSDVSLLHLSTPLEFTSTTRPAMLATENNMQDGDQLLIAGWGRRQLEGPLHSNTLQKLVVLYLTHSYCHSLFPQLQVANGSFCVQPPPFSGACHGDAGSPVIDANLRVMGLISLGIPCAQGYPDVAVSIVDKYSWIENITKSQD